MERIRSGWNIILSALIPLSLYFSVLDQLRYTLAFHSL
jgi:hypothetical protein